MSDKKYSVIFKGDVAAGVQIDDVKQKLAAIFKTDIAKIDRLFSGKRKVIKKGADLEACEKAKKAFERAGAICFIEPEEGPEPEIIESKPPEVPEVKPPPLPPEGRVVVRQEQGVNKVALVLLTFFLGGLGVHKFYLGKYVQGVIYFLFFWTLIPGIIAFVEFIIYACTSDERLQEKYTAKGPIAVIIIAVCAGFFFMIAIIGILAAIAIPQFMTYRDRAYQTSVISELNNLRAAEEAYFETHNRYSDNMDDLDFILTTPGVTVELISADEECFEAIGTIDGLREPVLIDCNGLTGR
ncbi:MAG: TM2 domain-containing protein [Deltaproteobacteria bacterium]|nr:TM2 domain-containing protein [Deltaproteobacteria bacterium]